MCSCTTAMLVLGKGHLAPNTVEGKRSNLRPLPASLLLAGQKEVPHEPPKYKEGSGLVVKASINIHTHTHSRIRAHTCFSGVPKHKAAPLLSSSCLPKSFWNLLLLGLGMFDKAWQIKKDKR